MALKQRFIKMLLALIAVCAFTACTNPADGTAGGNTGGGGTPSVPEYTVRFSAGKGRRAKHRIRKQSKKGYARHLYGGALRKHLYSR